MDKSTQTGWKQLALLFWTFFKLGPLTFGGGFAMIPALEREVVGKRGWIGEEDVVDVFAVAGAAPGAIAVNAAIFIGYRLKGIKGAVAALCGILLPTFVIVVSLCLAYLHAGSYPKVQAALEGIGAATVALIVHAGLRMGRSAVLDLTTAVAAAGSFLFLLVFPVNPIYVLLIGSAAGYAFVHFRRKLGYAESVHPGRKNGSYKYSDYFIGDGI